jgi:hypothetical protein
MNRILKTDILDDMFIFLELFLDSDLGINTLANHVIISGIDDFKSVLVIFFITNEMDYCTATLANWSSNGIFDSCNFDDLVFHENILQNNLKNQNKIYIAKISRRILIHIKFFLNQRCQTRSLVFF